MTLKTSYGLAFLFITLASGCAQVRDGAEMPSSMNPYRLVFNLPLPTDAKIRTELIMAPNTDEDERVVAFSGRSQSETLSFYLKEPLNYGWELKARKYGQPISLKFIKESQLVTVEIAYRGVALENNSQITLVREQ